MSSDVIIIIYQIYTWIQIERLFTLNIRQTTDFATYKLTHTNWCNGGSILFMFVYVNQQMHKPPSVLKKPESHSDTVSRQKQRYDHEKTEEHPGAASDSEEENE